MPRFPFRRSPGQDLRDLFAHDRLQAQANTLGYSSLSPGEGSAEVRDGTGKVVAQFGHDATGKLGFLVPDGPGWQTVQEQAAKAADAATAPLSGKVTTLEGKTSTLEGKVSTVEGKVTTLEGRADSHASRIGAAENDITALQSGKVSTATHNALAGRVGALENVDVTHKGKINALIDYVAGLEADMRVYHPGKAPANPPSKIT